jgi:hypothetical protein
MATTTTAPKLTDLQASFVRTLTPVLAGGLTAVGVKHGTDVSPQLLSGLITGWYTIGRLGEHTVNRRFGWMLGYAKKPEYRKPGAAPAQPSTEAVETVEAVEAAAVDAGLGRVRIGDAVLDGVQDLRWTRPERGPATLTVTLACPAIALDGATQEPGLAAVPDQARGVALPR